MNIVIRDEAARDLDEIYGWIEKDSPAAAVQMVRRIRAKINLLLTPGMADMGRLGRDEGTRELIEGPYIVVYEVDVGREEIIVLAVFHGAQDR
jgi:plasmid stabilization system protein ParE